VHRDLGKPSVPMLSAAMSGSSLRPENTLQAFCILAARSDPSAPKPSEFRVQGVYMRRTHGKPTKIALQYKPLLVSCVRAAWARLNTHMTQH